MHTLTFDHCHRYSDREVGIVLRVVLRLRDFEVELKARLDTGAENCIFAREYGEMLDLPIEEGSRLRFDTAAGHFDTYGHWITVSACGTDVDCLAYFAHLPGFTHNVLGIHGWINKFQMGIDHDQCNLFLRQL